MHRFFSRLILQMSWSIAIDADASCISFFHSLIFQSLVYFFVTERSMRRNHLYFFYEETKESWRKFKLFERDSRIVKWIKLPIDYSRFIEHSSNETTYEDSKEKEKVKRGGEEREKVDGLRRFSILRWTKDTPVWKGAVRSVTRTIRFRCSWEKNCWRARRDSLRTIQEVDRHNVSPIVGGGRERSK